VILAGATATGKSAVAIEAARAAGAEIVGVDALQIYRRLELGTAKPTLAERALVPHHLVDLFEPEEECSAGEFARRARSALAEIAARGRSALVVGGSGFYLRALVTGLAPTPPVPRALRTELSQRLRREGASALRAELERLDPESAARIGRNDSHRSLRALEVVLATGRSLSSWHAEQTAESPLAITAQFGLTLPRAVLYDRIARRVRDMVARGWPREVEELLSAGVARDAPALRAIGYADWVRHLDGELGREETIDRIVIATRRYAKRQETWFRRAAGIVWLDGREPARAIDLLARALGD
jgi:tRNA dimethylallyltransferase